MRGAWNWIGRAADFATVGGLAVALVLAAIIGAESEFRRVSPIWTWIAVVGVALLVFGSIRHLLRWRQTRVHKPTDEPLFRHKRLRLADLVGPDSILRDQVFEDCDIYGPAILASIGQGVGGFDSCTWEAPTAESILFEVPDGRVGVGMMGVVNCVFKRCRFYKIGLMGPPAQIAAWRAAVPTPSSPGDSSALSTANSPQ